MLRTQEVWVATNDGVVAGFAAIDRDKQLLSQLYVSPQHQGRGVGSQLLNVAKGQLQAGFSLRTFQRNTNARRFYEQHGFILVALSDGNDNEENEPDALFEWSGK